MGVYLSIYLLYLSIDLSIYLSNDSMFPLDDCHDEDLLLIALVLQCLLVQVNQLVGEIESILTAHIREQRRLCRSLPAEKIRLTWQSFKHAISAVHFRRMFRMNYDCFDDSCRKISAKIGTNVFKAESSDCRSGTVCGEIKLALSLRMLAGGSYLDLVPLFNVSVSGLYLIFGEFLDWVLATFEFPLVAWMREEKWGILQHLATQFGEKSNGVFYGAFGALDGLAIRITCPTLHEVPDPGNYYCRKGFYALNVQAICDKKKRFHWCYPSNKGSTHDSAAFALAAVAVGISCLLFSSIVLSWTFMS